MCIGKDHPRLSLRRQCRLLSLSRSTLYHAPVGETAGTLANSFAAILRPRFFQYIDTITDADGDAIRANPTTREIDEAIRELTSGIPVLKVKIYNLDALTVYSSDFSHIGEYNANNIGFVRAAFEAKPASKFSFRGSFSTFSGALANRSLAESYVPIIGKNGRVEGVFELYTDVTPLVDSINRETARVVVFLFIAFALLYGTLFLIVRRADSILRLQYASLIRNSADLNAQNLALEHEIADRQRAEEALRASERQLRQTQRMEAIGQLTGGLAHDFNNLLAIIQESVDLLEDQLEPDNRLLATIQRATTRGAELTQRLLAYSRKQTLNTRPFDLARLVAGMSEFLTRTLGATIEIAVDADPNLMSALADPGQVENALLNLTLNARDAMPKGGKLTIECRNAQLDEAYVARNPEAKAGNYVVLAVSDEDDRDVSALVVGVLEGLNYRVIDAADAASAHEVLANGTPVDPVLSDVVLPGGTSGPGFAEQVRKNDPDLKIIFMSGYPAEAAKRAGFLDSGQVLLNKPFQRPQLVTALRAMLD